MEHSTSTDSDDPVVLYRWTARGLQPIILLYVALVFIAFMMPAFFVFHSPAAVKALAMAAFGSIVSLFATLVSKTEYQLTGSGLEKRALNLKTPRAFKSVFGWDQLSHVVPIKHGFKYYKVLVEPKPLSRFWKLHISDAYSGQVRVEAGDRDTVLGILEQHGVPTSNPKRRT
jgi:hypothetical protein